jgi:hypothetical protein
MTSAMAEWLDLVARFDAGSGWSWPGMISCAHWLGWRCSISPVTAREHVRVARRLSELPVISAAFRRGELSYSKVRALARFECINDEEEILEMARVASASQLERIARATRRVTRAEAAAAVDARHLDITFDDDGTAVIHGRVPAEDGALLLRALAHADAHLNGAPPPTDARDTADSAESGQEERAGGSRFTPPPSPARRADALGWLADQALTRGPAAERSAGERTEVLVHVDSRLLTASDDASETAARHSAGPLTGPSPCGLDEGVALAAETARRLCCDAGIVPVVREGDRTLAVGRRTRAIPSAIRRALRLRYPTCGFPGCDRTRWLDAHHVRHWAHGGRTDLDNLIHLCRHHHRLVHEGGWRLEPRSEGGWHAYAPNGLRLVASPDAPPAHPVGPLEDDVPRWSSGSVTALMPVAYGERYELDLCVDAMLGWTTAPPEGEDRLAAAA